jgi:hypothetical protein
MCMRSIEERQLATGDFAGVHLSAATALDGIFSRPSASLPHTSHIAQLCFPQAISISGILNGLPQPCAPFFELLSAFRAGSPPSSSRRYSVKAHKTMMNAIDGCGGANVGYGAPELATAGRDGAVKICTRQLHAVVHNCATFHTFLARGPAAERRACRQSRG